MIVPRMLTAAVVVIVLASPRAAAQQHETFAAPAWTRDAVCYEIFVRSFYDSDGDGVGDLRGLIQKLDYINDGDPTSQRDLGATCIWLMPVAQSPSYHGYDVIDYYRIDSEYGTNEDFTELVLEAHRRGIRVLVDLVLNHVSSEHPYFQDALHNLDSPYRDWFVWLPSHPSGRNPWGGDNWHRSPVRDEYYYGFFWHGMPDLNYETPAVREEAKKIATFWLEELRVDGFRLDAVSFLAEEENGRVVQHASLTHAVLREFAAHVRRVAPAAYTVGEVWDSIGPMLPYYPDQLDAYFAFEASDAIIESVRAGSAAILLEPFVRLQRQVPNGRWALFLRNHDQTRTVTALGGDVARAKVAATLLLTLPGFPFVYYGEEIGMSGDKPDPRLRTPMHWNRTPAAEFTTGVPWEPLQPDSFTANVDVQDADSGSLLNLYRRLIHLRRANSALARGALEPLTTDAGAVAAYLRHEETRAVLVVANLGTTPQPRVQLSSEHRVLSPGRYSARDLLDGLAAPALTVHADGRIDGYVPVASLPPLASYLFELTPTIQ